MSNFLPTNTINPISGCTRDAEISAGSLIGGHLPFDAFESMIQRDVISYPDKNRKKSKKPAIRAMRAERITL